MTGAHLEGVLPKSFWRRRSAAVSAAARSTTPKPVEFRALIGNPGCCGWDTRAPFHLGNTPWTLHQLFLVVLGRHFNPLVVRMSRLGPSPEKDRMGFVVLTPVMTRGQVAELGCKSNADADGNADRKGKTKSRF